MTVTAGAGAVRLDPAALPAAPGEDAEIAFATSGHTQSPRMWLRTHAQLRAEARLLGELPGLAACDGIVSSAPLEHLYGYVAGVCLARELDLPLWLLPPGALGVLPDVPASMPVVVALPSMLAWLERQPRWLGARPGACILHSAAKLPAVARRVADGHAPVKLHELFGSTETGLVATREVSGRHDPPWELARDVTFAEPPTTVRPVRLAVAGPRLARPPGRPRPARHTLTDEVEPLDDRRFRLVGRSTRLIKLGGRRVDLDAVEASLRHVLDCRDLACAGLRDDLRAESYELLVVPHRGRVVDLGEVRRKAREALGRGCEPRRVRVVAELARSGTGKVLWEQPR